jgi:uncharacterized protein
VVLKVRVQPHAPHNQIMGFDDSDMLKVKVCAPAHEGQANQQLIEYLAKCLSIRKSAITIKSGAGARIKFLEIMGLEKKQLVSLLQGSVPCPN